MVISTCCIIGGHLGFFPIFSHQNNFLWVLEKRYGTFCIIGGHLGHLCVIVDQVLEHKIPQNKKCYFEHESQVCVSAVHPDMMYDHDNWDFIWYFGGHFVLQFWKGKTKKRAWHGADLESAYPNCVKTTAWQILLRNALQTLRMPLFKKWAPTTSDC